MQRIHEVVGVLKGSIRAKLEARKRKTLENESLQLLAKKCGDVIFRFGIDGRARYISPSVERLYGYTLKEIYALGGSVVQNDFIFEDDREAVAEAVRGHFSGALPEVKLEFRIKKRDGSLLWVETNCTTVLDAKTGRPTDIVFTMRDISDKKALEVQLQALARRDGLTGLANRRAFDEVLEQEWKGALRKNGTLTLLVLDVDSFKEFNDANGHQAGDDCLRTVAAAISNHLAIGQVAARYGGEEFAVILPNTDYNTALAAGESIRSMIEALKIPHIGNPASAFVTISVGVATAMAANGGTVKMPHGLLQAADAAMYKAKAGGRNRVEGALLFSPIVSALTAA